MNFTNYISHAGRLQINENYDKSCNTLIGVINRKRILPGEYHIGAYHLNTNLDDTIDLLATDYPRPSKLVFCAITKRDMFYFLTGVLKQLSN